MIYYKSPKEDWTLLLEYLPQSIRNNLTKILLPARIVAADNLRNGSLGHPHFDMKSFIASKSIFVHIPKAAGRSIRKQIYNGVTCSHTTLYWYSLALRHYSTEDYFLYTIVRNPWDRLHSAYYFLKKGGAHVGDETLFKKHLSKYKTFEEFVLDMPQSGIPPIVHMKPMHYFLELRNGKTLVNYVGYFEDLEMSYRYILSKIPSVESAINKNTVLCHENSNTVNKNCYVYDYTDEMIDVVSTIYKRDIALFGYTFEGFSRARAIFEPCCVS